MYFPASCYLLSFFRLSGGSPNAEIERSSQGEEKDQWWFKMIKDDDQFSIEHSGKLILLFEILAMAEQIGDKVYVLCIWFFCWRFLTLCYLVLTYDSHL
jgi:hypothetical protein